MVYVYLRLEDRQLGDIFIVHRRNYPYVECGGTDWEC
jgi:hypothetical protein